MLFEIEKPDSISIATTHFFINTPKAIDDTINQSLIGSVRDQVTNCYQQAVASQTIFPIDLTITNVSVVRGCIIIKISLSVNFEDVSIVKPILRQPKLFKSSLYALGSSVKEVVVSFNGKKVNMTACIQKIVILDETEL